MSGMSRIMRVHAPRSERQFIPDQPFVTCAAKVSKEPFAEVSIFRCAHSQHENLPRRRKSVALL